MQCADHPYYSTFSIYDVDTRVTPDYYEMCTDGGKIVPIEFPSFKKAFLASYNCIHKLIELFTRRLYRYL